MHLLSHVLIGNQALGGNNNTNVIAIGNQVSGNGSNSVTIGNDDISKTVLKGNIGIGESNPSEAIDINREEGNSVIKLNSNNAWSAIDFFNDGNFNVATAIMEYVTTQTLGNSTDFGDHLNGKQHGACSDATRGLICGGDTAAAGNTRTNVISYVTTQTASNSADFGDLTVARSRCGVASDGTYATIVGGRPVNVPSNVTGVIDKVTVQTAANATDYGDMLTEGQYIESVSGAAS